MARYPGAVWRPVPNFTKGGNTPKLVITHIMVGTLAGTDSWFRNPASDASSHFGVGKDGTVYQWVDTADMAWHAMDANSHSVGVEYEGMPGDALTPAQLQAGAKILVWAHRHHPDISMWLTLRPSGSGLAWHGLGGAAWGDHLQCPGRPIVGELPEMLAIAKAMLRPALPYKFGALPHDPAKPKLLLSPHRDASFQVPTAVDYHSNVRGQWGMYLNGDIGDCTCAEVAHQIISSATYARGFSGSPYPLVRTWAVLKMYEAVSGYDPVTGENDNGAVIQDVLNHWRKVGCGTHKCVAFASMNVADMNEIHHGVYVFGSANIGLPISQSAMDQFHAGQAWDVVPDDGGILGGHCVEVVGYDQDYLYVVTWGRVQKMTYAFWAKYVEEAWVVILPEWLSAQGTDPLGVDLQGLESALWLLTGTRTPLTTTREDLRAA